MTVADPTKLSRAEQRAAKAAAALRARLDKSRIGTPSSKTLERQARKRGRKSY